jgi:hypothetical protein
MLISNPVTFIKPDTEIESKFLDENDTYIWYKCTVNKINELVINTNGCYVDCDVIYDDGEEVVNSVFHDIDFEEDSDTAWRFTHQWSKLIKIINKKDEEIKQLREDLDFLEETLTSINTDEEDEDEEKEDDNEEEQNEEEEEEQNEEKEDENVEKCKQQYIRKINNLNFLLYSFVGVTGIITGIVIGDILVHLTNHYCNIRADYS